MNAGFFFGGRRFAYPSCGLGLVVLGGGVGAVSTFFVYGGCYFFTVNALERKGFLLVDHIGLLRRVVVSGKTIYESRCLGMMPIFQTG